MDRWIGLALSLGVLAFAMRTRRSSVFGRTYRERQQNIETFGRAYAHNVDARNRWMVRLLIAGAILGIVYNALFLAGVW